VSAQPAERNQAIDWLRGAVMILMALDHSRMFVGSEVDLHTASAALYFTRWITHFCAPVFVLLAGMAAYLHGQKLGSTGALSRYLFTRGLWLAFLEITVVRLVWMLYIGPQILVLQVIWAIGVSMMVLAGLVWLPRAAIAAIAVALIAGHNLLDTVHAADLGAFRWLWLLLHEHGQLEPFPGARWFVIYPLVPWVAVMAAGYLIGPGRCCPAPRGAPGSCAPASRSSSPSSCCARSTSMAIRSRGRPTAARCARCCRSSTAKSIRRRCSSWR
jgi:uncharacterized membrane protein